MDDGERYQIEQICKSVPLQADQIKVIEDILTTQLELLEFKIKAEYDKKIMYIIFSGISIVVASFVKYLFDKLPV